MSKVIIQAQKNMHPLRYIFFTLLNVIVIGVTLFTMIGCEETTSIMEDPKSDPESTSIEGSLLVPDANLRTAIALKLEMVDDTAMTKEDMTHLTELIAEKADISNLTGLEYAINLKRLDLWDNNIVDLSPLAGLTKLEELWLNSNAIVDVSPLAGLTNLRMLDLQDNAIVDVSPLEVLTKLSRGEGLLESSWLYLSGNPIGIVSIPDTVLRKIIERNLRKESGEPITQEDMLHLIEIERLGGDQGIFKLTGLEHAKNLEWLDLSGDNQIIDVSPLAGLTELEFLSLHDNRIADVSPLAKLTKLRDLGLAFNAIVDVSPLTKLTKLERLQVQGNPLSVASKTIHILAIEANGTSVFHVFE